MDAARELGIVVAGTGSLVTPTAELTWALILALCRNVVVEDAALRAGGWQHTIGPDLAGRRSGCSGSAGSAAGSPRSRRRSRWT